jgi:hypothetical protein
MAERASVGAEEKQTRNGEGYWGVAWRHACPQSGASMAHGAKQMDLSPFFPSCDRRASRPHPAPSRRAPAHGRGRGACCFTNRNAWESRLSPSTPRPPLTAAWANGVKQMDLSPFLAPSFSPQCSAFVASKTDRTAQTSGPVRSQSLGIPQRHWRRDSRHRTNTPDHGFLEGARKRAPALLATSRDAKLGDFQILNTALPLCSSHWQCIFWEHNPKRCQATLGAPQPSRLNARSRPRLGVPPTPTTNGRYTWHTLVQFKGEMSITGSTP